MEIMIFTPATGNCLQIFPSLNLYFQEDDNMLSTTHHLEAVEIGWFGFSLWFAKAGY